MRCDQSSQLYMCRSVPQMAVLSPLISTSLVRTSGTGTCSIQIPGCGARLTSAFIVLMASPLGPRFSVFFDYYYAEHKIVHILRIAAVRAPWRGGTRRHGGAPPLTGC